jgi:Protein of unknown function (DUF2878)
MLAFNDRRVRLLINFVAFQTAWFAVVLGAAHDFLWRGMLVAIAVVLLHLWMSRQPLRELQLVILAILLGTMWDSVVAANHIIHYPSGQFSPYIAPVWIMAMWALFATTLNVSLLFLRGRPLLAAAFGGIGAPLSFLAGMRLQALQFPDTTLAMTVLAIGWALIMPVLMALSVRFDGVNTPVANS